jgi:hypothetical protein
MAAYFKDCEVTSSYTKRRISDLKRIKIVRIAQASGIFNSESGKPFEASVNPCFENAKA